MSEGKLDTVGYDHFKFVESLVTPFDETPHFFYIVSCCIFYRIVCQLE